MAELIANPEVHTLSQLFGHIHAQYRVPLYQRDYAWGNDQIDDFLADAFGISSDGEHFFGSLVLSDDSPGASYDGPGEVSYVIDGQQRLITSLLFLTAIRHHLNELAEAVAEPEQEDLRQRSNDLLVYTSAGLGRDRRPKLFANRINERFLSPLVQGELRDGAHAAAYFRGLAHDVREGSEYLRRAYRRLRSQIVRRITGLRGDDPRLRDGDLAGVAADLSLDPRALARQLSDLSERVCNKSLFVVIRVRRWQDAFAVFEGLNNRGLELSEKDLVKTSILARAHNEKVPDDELRRMEERWTRLTGKIAESKFANFLRHYLLLHRKDVPLKRVIRLLSEHFEPQTADQMLRELERAADAYGRLTRPSVWEDDPKLRDALQRLNLLEGERAYPVPLAAMLTDVESGDVARLIGQVETFYFRRSSIMQLDGKILEDDIQEAASALYESGPSGVADAIAAVANITPSDNDFVERFKTRSKIKASVARYMLVRIERHLNKGRVSQAESKATLEHIMPEDPSQWALSRKELDDHAELHTMIGNLTLLSAEWNSQASNRPFSEKLAWYRDDDLKINGDVISRAVWDRLAIETRQGDLARLAVQVWNR